MNSEDFHSYGPSVANLFFESIQNVKELDEKAAFKLVKRIESYLSRNVGSLDDIEKFLFSNTNRKIILCLMSISMKLNIRNDLIMKIVSTIIQSICSRRSLWEVRYITLNIP